MGVFLAASFFRSITWAELDISFTAQAGRAGAHHSGNAGVELSSHLKKPRKLLVFFLALGYIHESIPYGNEVCGKWAAGRVPLTWIFRRHGCFHGGESSTVRRGFIQQHEQAQIEDPACTGRSP